MFSGGTAYRAALAVATGVAIAFILSACSGGSESSSEGGHGEGNASTAPAEPAEPGTVAPKTYDEPQWQERFAYWYTQYYSMYQPVAVGLRIRVNLESGNNLTGAYMGLTNGDHIAIMTLRGMTNFAPAELTAGTRERIIAEDFAVMNAKREVEAERASGGAPSTGEASATNAVPADPIEKRFSTTEAQGLDFRVGPGKHFKPVPGVAMVKGELINVVEERNGWVCFNGATTNGAPVKAWVNKYATLPQNDVNLEAQEHDIQTLQENGIIVEFIASNNIARVDIDLWNELDYLVRQGIGRNLAFYCGAKRGTGLNWVEFRDMKSGKRIAKFSESQGLKIYNL